MQTVTRKANNTTPKKLVVKKAAAKKTKGNIDVILKSAQKLREKGISLDYLKK